MKEVINKISELRNLSGNAQIAYLNEIKDTPYLREVLEYTLDKDKMYKITDKKYNRSTPPMFNILTSSVTEKSSLTVDIWEKFKKELDYLSEVKASTDLDVQKIRNIIDSCVESDAAFLKMILFKDLRINMDAKKIRNVWPDFLPSFPYMGCRAFTQKNLNALNFPCYAQTKMDGTFCNVVIDLKNKEVSYISRQSKTQPMKGCFLDKFCDNWTGDEHFTDKFVLTGEALVWDNEKNKPLPRKLSNGILRREDKTPDELDRIHFTCWDFVPYDNFIERKWNIPYKDRYTWLKTCLDDFMGKLHIVNTWEVNSLEEAEKIFDEQYAQGEEGIVVKELTQIWQDGKPKGQVKMKAEKDCDLEMLDFYEGKGQYEGMCGSIKCTSSDGILEVMVKPRTPKDALEVWDNQDFYRHKILSITFNEVITSETKDKPSLYLPRFVEIRDDKVEADTFEAIKEL